MTTYLQPLCFWCQHFGERKPAGGRVCAAFPDDIPAPIMRMEYDHRLPYPGDQGIRFQLAEGKEIPFYYAAIKKRPTVLEEGD